MSRRQGIFGPDIFDEDEMKLDDTSDRTLPLLEGKINSFLAEYERAHGHQYTGEVDVPLNQNLLEKISMSGRRKLIRDARKAGWAVAKIIRRKGTDYLHLEE